MGDFILFFNFKRSKVLGFTLAEVLVTVGIIGVVAALTMPTLVQNHQRKVYVTQLRKVCTELEQSFVRYINDRNAVNLREAGNLTTTDGIASFFNRYFNVVKECNDSFCFTDYKCLDGDCYGGYFNTERSVNLSSGALIGFNEAGVDNLFINFLVDVNGEQGPNIAGRDIFFITADVNGKLEDFGYMFAQIVGGGQDIDREDIFEQGCASQGLGCYGKVVLDGWEMKY